MIALTYRIQIFAAASLLTASCSSYGGPPATVDKTIDAAVDSGAIDLGAEDASTDATSAVDAATDGGCSMTCNEDEICENVGGSETCVKRCQTTALPNFCEGACVNIESDPDHCGGCGRRCGGDRFCMVSVCSDPPADGGVDACVPSTEVCDGVDNDCDRIGDSLESSGICARPNTECSNKGGWDCHCAPDFGECDENVGNGCEGPFFSNTAHCGECNNDCNSLPHIVPGSAVCSGGTCGFECQLGFEDCDGDPSDGCEQMVGGGACEDRDAGL